MNETIILFHVCLVKEKIGLFHMCTSETDDNQTRHPDARIIFAIGLRRITLTHNNQIRLLGSTAQRERKKMLPK